MALSVFQSPPFGASHCNATLPIANARAATSFSPLHSGQATAISRKVQPQLVGLVFQSPPFGASHCNLVTQFLVNRAISLSVPSIRGKPLQFLPGIAALRLVHLFQSPPFGASHCNPINGIPSCKKVYLSVPSIRGKPLQLAGPIALICKSRSFSPLHSGQATAILHSLCTKRLNLFFQSPPFGASHCNNIHRPALPGVPQLSVPSIRGKPLQFLPWPSWPSPNLTFSPLHSGQATAMMMAPSIAVTLAIFQSPPFGASHCN